MTEMRREEVRKLVDIVADGIRVLRTRDGVQVSDEQALERANNIVCALVSGYEMHEVADD
jgi:hypothetical protein